MENRITKLFGIKYPIIQGGMVWCAPWQLASAVSNAGGLGLIGAASMYPEVLKEHIEKCQKATTKPFGVNVPLLYPDIKELMDIIIAQGVKIVFTSAGNPKTWTSQLKEEGITVVHVVPGGKFAQKAEQAGVDAVVAEGFEAGGHNGRDETTTLCLVPSVKQQVETPLIAAGGIASGRSMLAAMALGAEGVQVGSRFAASTESSAHSNFKDAIVGAKEGDTQLTMKQLTPVRLIKNKFFNDVAQAEGRCATIEEMKELLGRARAKRGMFEGEMDEGELEIGQVSAHINNIKPAGDILKEMMDEFNKARMEMATDKFTF